MMDDDEYFNSSDLKETAENFEKRLNKETIDHMNAGEKLSEYNGIRMGLNISIKNSKKHVSESTDALKNSIQRYIKSGILIYSEKSGLKAVKEMNLADIVNIQNDMILDLIEYNGWLQLKAQVEEPLLNKVGKSLNNPRIMELQIQVSEAMSSLTDALREDSESKNKWEEKKYKLFESNIKTMMDYTLKLSERVSGVKPDKPSEEPQDTEEKDEINYDDPIEFRRYVTDKLKNSGNFHRSKSTLVKNFTTDSQKEIIDEVSEKLISSGKASKSGVLGRQKI